MGPEGQYAREVKRLLSFFGLTVDFQFPGYVPFSKWSQVTEASLSVLLGTAGQPEGMKERALWLEREFGIPFWEIATLWDWRAPGYGSGGSPIS